MLGFLQKYNQLPQELRDKISGKEVMVAINELEKKYEIGLSAAVVKIMIKEIPAGGISDFFIGQGLDKNKAENLSEELKEKVFKDVGEYLGIKKASADRPEKNASGAVLSQKTESGPPAQAANFFFSPEDEEEIREIAKKSDNQPNKPISARLDGQVDEVFRLAKINFGSAMLIERFKGIIKIYLRGIRDRISTKQALSKPFESGGLSFDNNSIDEILSIADSIVKNPPAEAAIPREFKIKTPELEQERIASLKSLGARDIDYNLASELKKRNVAKTEGAALEAQRRLAPPPPALNTAVGQAGSFESGNVSREKKAPSAVPGANYIPMIRQAEGAESGQAKDAPAIATQIGAEKKSDSSAAIIGGARSAESAAAAQAAGPKPEADAALPAVAADKKAELSEIAAQAVPQRPQEAKSGFKAEGKIKMEDVKVIPKAFGPIDELKYMDLTSFRRLDKDGGAIAKIKNKISLLEEENYVKRLEGIKAWRGSPVNKLYLQMGNESINGKKQINAIIEEWQAVGREYLNSQEFEAIMDLNRELRF